jgi:hypothetical protein
MCQFNRTLSMWVFMRREASADQADPRTATAR